MMHSSKDKVSVKLNIVKVDVFKGILINSGSVSLYNI